MFGVIAAGRLVQTDFQQVSETQFLINLQDADKVNHLVVFLTGQVPFPDTMGGAVYFSSTTISGSSWQLLGHLTNAKPSAMFKIANLKKNAQNNTGLNPFGQLTPLSSTGDQSVIQLGISVEPLDQILQQTTAANTTASTVDTFREFSQKMLENFYNYMSSFALTQSQMVPNPSESFIPASVLQRWFTNFERKMQQDPYFWKS